MILDVIVVDVVDELIIISIMMMIVLVDDGDDGEGVEYSHAIITSHQLGLLSLSLSMSCNHIQTTKSNMSLMSNTKASALGYLIHFIACPHWPMHRHAESKPLSLPSSTRVCETSAER